MIRAISHPTNSTRYPFDNRHTVDGPRKAALLVQNVISSGFSTLRNPIQTIEARRTQLAKYYLATRELREALAVWPASPALFTPVLFFAIYEMTVNLDQGDKTWQIHLDGLLNLLSQMSYRSKTAPLPRAMMILDSGDDLRKALASSATGGPDIASLLLDVTKLRLRKLIPEMDVLFRDASKHKRKLDVQKLRVLVRQIYKDLGTFPAIISKQFRHITVVDIGIGLSDIHHTIEHTASDGKI
ncbi:hypothetical protein TruAng_009131 [Truncatella angustata]|nr:hypothetical protein TruAng_009131 [Truncatella angustata]